MAWRTFRISLLTFAAWMPANIFALKSKAHDRTIPERAETVRTPEDYSSLIESPRLILPPCTTDVYTPTFT